MLIGGSGKQRWGSQERSVIVAAEFGWSDEGGVQGRAAVPSGGVGVGSQEERPPGLCPHLPTYVISLIILLALVGGHYLSERLSDFPEVM